MGTKTNVIEENLIAMKVKKVNTEIQKPFEQHLFRKQRWRTICLNCRTGNSGKQSQSLNFFVCTRQTGRVSERQRGQKERTKQKG